ncbi:MAG: hypothetical protein F6K00_06435 [Leptolyngbya sp. SIOISBB]|nr:hypothetical protein [Leptolyngbya sp. SIOISBB]
MFWLSISTHAPELQCLSPHTRPWSVVKTIWQFCQTYGEYQSLPPSQRRRFILEREASKAAQTCPDSCL